ncbi:hypothetical protein ES288_A11G331900v1 [Gossypium darwinii]|uniref:Uncharacterized protein n=1 Tax=Gossypium darwinii TaxID=34276 RepID=A0A5D2ERC2_GOSDA|nr:hypothetical protein ES288_A11G331900v1 [Gossypium darwinii]
MQKETRNRPSIGASRKGKRTQEESLTVRAEFVALSTEWKSSEEARPLITFFFFVSFWFKHNWIQTIFKLSHQTNIKMTE